MSTPNNIMHIKYTKSSTGEENTRYIIPSFFPSDNITAIDVSDLNEDSREEIAELHKEYSKYRQMMQKQIMNFEDWLTLTTGDDSFKPKWRTFKVSNTEFL